MIALLALAVAIVVGLRLAAIAGPDPLLPERRRVGDGL